MSVATTTVDLKTLLKLALPIGSRLVTGSLNAPVSRIYHLRTRPQLSDDIQGGELVLLSMNALAGYQKPLTPEVVIEELAQMRVSAVGISGTLTPRAHQVAKTHNMTLVAFPDRVTLPQVERAVQRFFNNHQAQVAHRAFELQQTLQRHAAGHRGLTTMLNVLARLLDRPVVVHDRQGTVISRGLPGSQGHQWDSHLALAAGAEFVRRFDLEDRCFYEDDWQIIESPAGMTAPLIQDGQLLGYVSVLSAGNAPDEFDLLVLEYSAPTFARELVRQQTLEPVVDSTLPPRDWIADWLSNPAADDNLLTLRAEKNSFRADLCYAVVLFHWLPSNDRIAGAFSPERMVRLIQNELHQRRIQAPVGQYVDRVVLLFPLDEPQQTQRLKQITELLHAVLVQSMPDGEITAGVGRPVRGLTALRESFQEAERALTLSEQLWNESQVAFFGDVSLYELLLGVSDPQMLSNFCTHWLSPLMAYDDQHHTDLLPTLSAYFAHNGNMARTAHVLNIHRNTLVYRLSRITEIMQLDMDDPNVRLNLQLALKVQRMLNSPDQNQLAS